MASEHLLLAGLFGTVIGLGSAGLMFARLVRATRRSDPRAPGPGLGATIVALVASVMLAAASMAVVGALVVRREPASLDVAAVSRPPIAPPPALDAHGGRPLASDAGRLGDTRDATWPLLRMHARIPAAWVARASDPESFVLHHPTTPSTYLLGRANPMPAGPSPHDYLASHVDHARAQLEAGHIAGFATMRLGAIAGLMTLARRDDGAGWLVTWTGFQPAELGSIAVTIALGAASDDFERDEPLLGAILGDVRFE